MVINLNNKTISLEQYLKEYGVMIDDLEENGEVSHYCFSPEWIKLSYNGEILQMKSYDLPDIVQEMAIKLNLIEP